MIISLLVPRTSGPSGRANSDDSDSRRGTLRAHGASSSGEPPPRRTHTTPQFRVGRVAEPSDTVPTYDVRFFLYFFFSVSRVPQRRSALSSLRDQTPKTLSRRPEVRQSARARAARDRRLIFY